MRLVLRVLLVWLMVQALPLQGFAVAGMLHCGPVQVSLAAAVATTADVVPASHVHHHQVDAADADAQAAGHAHLVAADNAAMGDYPCSACAACCLALALPATAVKLPPVRVDAMFSASASPALPSFVPAGLGG